MPKRPRIVKRAALMEDKQVEVRCTVCGEIFTAHAANAKYCPECKKERQREQAEKKRLKRRQARPEQTRVQGWRQPDSPEQIEMCLSCTKPSCSGNCTLRKSAGHGASGKRGHRPRALDEAGEDKVYEMRQNGAKWNKIAEEMKISPGAIYRAYHWAEERKGKE